MRNILSLLMASTTLSLCAFTAFDKGKWQADIILPDAPNHAEAFAAKELQYHLGKVTGTVPVIAKEGEKSALNYHFYIGDTRAARNSGIKKSELAMDSHLIKTIKDGVIFVGGDRNGVKVGHQWSAACQGTLYAVYDYLGNDLGIRWIWPGELGEVIPKKEKLEIGNLDRSGKEPLICRRLRPVPMDKNSITGWNKLRNREAFHAAQELFLIRHRMGASENHYYSHAFGDYWQRFGKKNPEYFALLPNGKREPLAGDKSGTFTTMCVSNSAFQDQVIRDWIASRREGAPYYQPAVNACENDSPGMCTCRNCRDWDAKDPLFAASKYWGKGEDPLTRKGRFYRLAQVSWGEEGDEAKAILDPPSVSTRYAKFYMALLKKAKAVDPKAKVAGYAYANYRKPPRETKLDKDIMLIYVPGVGVAYTAEASAKFRKEWNGWRNCGISDIMLRPNHMLTGANFPVNFGRVIAGDFEFAAKNGMFGTNYDSLTGAFANQGAMLYTLIRIHRNPAFGYENSIREYCSAFGPAEKAIRSYVDFWEDFSSRLTREQLLKAGEENRDRSGSISGGHTNFVLIAHAIYPPEVFTQASAILDQASALAAGNATALKRIDFLRKGLRDAELTRNTSFSYFKWISAKRNNHSRSERVKLRQQFANDFNAMIAHRAAAEADMVCNFGYFAGLEAYSGAWPHKRNKISKVDKK